MSKRPTEWMGNISGGGGGDLKQPSTSDWTILNIEKKKEI